MEISLAAAHNRLSQWLKYLPDGPVTLTRRGKPIGVIIDPAEYERLSQVRAYLQMLGLSEELRDCGVTARELYEASREELENRS